MLKSIRRLLPYRPAHLLPLIVEHLLVTLGAALGLRDDVRGELSVVHAGGSAGRVKIVFDNK